MKKEKAQRKSRLLGGKQRKIVLVLLLCGVILVGSTWAYMKRVTNTKLNPLTFGEIEPDIEEKFLGWDVKEVKLVNVDGSGRVPGVVRAMIIPVLKDKTTGLTTGGDMAALSNPTGTTQVVMGDLTFKLVADWETHWFYKDGYFYYRTVLQPGEKTTILLGRVILTSDTPEMREKYKNITVTVEVLNDILQAEGGAASAAWGLTVNGTTVQP